MKKIAIIIVACIISYASTAVEKGSVGSSKEPLKKKAKIFVMFRGSGPAQEASALKYDVEEKEQKIITNEKIMDELKKRCQGVEFVGDISATGTEAAIRKVDNMPEDIDGIVIFGPLSGGHAFGGPLTEKLIKTDLPIITVFPLWGMWQESFSYQGYKGNKILTSHLSVIRDNSETVVSSRFEDLAGKINLIRALSEMKGFRILSVTDRPPLGGYTPSYGEEYIKTCVDNLKNVFGVELITIPQEELFDKIGEIHNSERDKAEQIANMWIDEAEEVKWDEVTRDDIIKSAELYLAMKELRDKYNCNTVTTEGYGIFAQYKKGPIPCQGLASMQLSTEGPVAAPSETLLYSLIVQQLGLNMTGRNGFNGDYIIDHFNQVAYVGHCEGPLNPYGDDRMCPYVIRDLPQQYEKQCGAVPAIKYPLNETVTVVGVGIYDKKISIFTGKTISGRSLFEDFDNIYCRSKIAVKTDAKALLKNVNWEIFNQHRVAFYGNFREEFKDMATIIGFEVVEEDR
jgi:hypothetical protein